jgi:hypothetical protein
MVIDHLERRKVDGVLSGGIVGEFAKREFEVPVFLIVGDVCRYSSKV